MGLGGCNLTVNQGASVVWGKQFFENLEIPNNAFIIFIYSQKFASYFRNFKGY